MLYLFADDRASGTGGRRAAILSGALACVLTLSSPGLAQEAASPAATPTLSETLGELVEAFRRQHAVPGVSLAISQGTELIHVAGYGLADLEQAVPVTPETRFRTASIAKPITAVAVMQCVEEGLLDLDADVRSVVPAFPEKQWPISLRQLLCHQSGVRHYLSGQEASRNVFHPTMLETVALFAESPLQHEPGTAMTYTTFGYTLLGVAVEQARGESFSEVLREHVFEPAGMSRSCVDARHAIIGGRTRFYRRLSPREVASLPEHRRAALRPDGVIHAQDHDTSMKIPGGGLLSTASDLVRFANAVRDAELVSEQTRDMMWTAQSLSDGTGTDYGLGFGVGNLERHRRISHSGGQAGTSTFLIALPDAEITVAVMTNLENAPLRQLAMAVMGQLLGQD